MKDSDKVDLKNPLESLRSAISKLEAFVEQDNLEIEDGELVIAKDKPLETMLERVRGFISSLFSEKAQQERNKKLQQIKQKILDAKDETNRYLPLLQRLQQGDSFQQGLAQRILEAIKKYNMAVSVSGEETISSWIKNRLLSDDEIKGRQIPLPQSLFVKYESHPSAEPAQRTIQTLSELFGVNVAKKELSAAPSYKQAKQVMEDAFRMKATRTIKAHLAQSNFLLDVLKLMQQTPINVDEEKDDRIAMRQKIELAPGSIITLAGAFKKQAAGSKFMSIPILVEDIHLSTNFVQTGYPYPSQHTGWALADPFVDASPLRNEQTPLFTALDQRRKEVAQQLLFNSAVISRARELAQQHGKIFNENRFLFLQLHEKFNQALAEAMNHSQELQETFQSFYAYIHSVSSPFKVLTHAQEQIHQLFVIQPAKKLYEDWLEGHRPLLRTGTASEKYHLATQLLKESKQQALFLLKEENVINNYLKGVGGLIQSAAETITLQYMSEKIGFAPPRLTNFERKMQRWAFHQLRTFLDYLEEKEVIPITKENLQLKWMSDFAFLMQEEELEKEYSIQLTNELESYFNSRFYSRVS